MLQLMTALDVVVVVLSVVVLIRVSKRRRSGSLPPGPKGWPLIGNVLDMPASHEWRTFAQWGERWGDIVSVTLLGQPMVILNSPKLAVEMLERKSSIYSDRPTFTMGGKLVGWDRTLVLLHYGSRFREYRRLFSQLIGSRKMVASYAQHMEAETSRFLARLLRQPDQLAKQVRKTAGGIILKMSHGYQVQEGEDPVVNIVDKAVEQFSLATAPGAFLVDVLPILEYVPSWMPGAGWKKKVEVWAKALDAMCDIPYDFVKNQMAAGTAVPSFTSMNLEDNVNPEHEGIVKDAASSLYSGGADTTVSAICTFFLAMMCYPEAQKKAQREIDAVIGNDRLPTLADRERLPYVNALCWEVFRWNPVVPQGVPHRLVEDDIHAGYLIPKGTIIIPNIWKFLHDPCTYHDPFTFNPDRFVPSETREAEQDPREYVFGFGRRICPGMYLADASVFLSCVMSLAAFDISKPVENGQIVEPVIEYSTGTISHPHPFKCSLKSRSAKMEALILSLA
ncbi:hypothetical protein AcV5_000150 [Taiwanofungus camphoratus]|nr:hypothetical protein AcV5_000150 [Antrodia cinnamomea]